MSDFQQRARPERGSALDKARKWLRSSCAKRRRLLVAPDASIVSERQRVADRFYAEGVLPAAVDVAPLMDASIFEQATAVR